MPIHFEARGNVAIVTLDRPEVANAIDRPTAAQLADAFRRFDGDDSLHVAVLVGANGTFCAGADLKAMREPGAPRASRLAPDGDGPVGPTRMLLGKPMIAAVEGHAVAGGLELAAWCDLRVAAEDAVFGVYCRRWGIPLMDGGTIRLARLIGHSHALDLILTGRGVSGAEALRMGLANRLVRPGTALEEALAPGEGDRVATPGRPAHGSPLLLRAVVAGALGSAAGRVRVRLAGAAHGRAPLGARTVPVGELARRRPLLRPGRLLRRQRRLERRAREERPRHRAVPPSIAPPGGLGGEDREAA